MTHELIKLPYANNALEPVISAETIQYHHGKHLKGYVDTLNMLLPDSDLKDASLEDLVRKAEGKLYNQAGQVMNHNMYFLQFAPKAGGQPEGKLAEAIKRDFGSFEEFQKAFNEACTSLFGSGWAWLASDNQGKLSIEKEPNAGNPLRKGLKPLMCFDVWEHAYYLTYQNRRADHVKDLWSIIDWKEIARRYEA